MGKEAGPVVEPQGKQRQTATDRRQQSDNRQCDQSTGRIKRKEFKLQLALDGTEFQMKVWQELMSIPYGTTITYGELARRIGNAKASRAVAMACHNNPISIIIPCHRVIGSNGKLTGYAGGLDKKAALLDIENNLFNK